MNETVETIRTDHAALIRAVVDSLEPPVMLRGQTKPAAIILNDGARHAATALLNGLAAVLARDDALVLTLHNAAKAAR